MKYANHLTNFYSSLLLISEKTRLKVIADGVSPGVTFLNLDEHSQIPEWPDNDVMGIGSLSVSIEDVSTATITAVFFSSTIEDPSLFRHMAVMNALFDQLIPMTNHPVVDALTGEILGSMTVEGGTQLMRMERTENRPIQYILASFATTLTYSPLP